MSQDENRLNRSFEHFPADETCPVCHTNDDLPCVLMVMDGTAQGNIAEAIVVHKDCAVATNYNKSKGIMYRRVYV